VCFIVQKHSQFILEPFWKILSSVWVVHSYPFLLYSCVCELKRPVVYFILTSIGCTWRNKVCCTLWQHHERMFQNNTFKSLIQLKVQILVDSFLLV
jgi:hypothetical protein